MSYFGNIKRGIKTTAKGMSLTLKHLAEARFSRAEKQIANDDFFELDKGHVTIQYPHQTIEIPDHGRNQLDCEIDDCIVCDKCAKICPVDCIEIEAIKSPELIRNTSDGSPVRLHAAKFDIDMAKCCFCGLCTTVCPTECLTMNSEYDYSVLDVTQLNFAFSNLSDEVAQEKRELYDQFMEEKAALKAEKLKEANPPKPAGSPVFRPGMKPAAKSDVEKPVARPVFKPSGENIPKPAFKPGMKPVAKAEEAKQAPRPVFKPTVKPASTNTPKPAFKPGMKPVAKTGESSKPVFKPSIKPKGESATKPVFKPGMKPVKKETGDTSDTSVAKPAFKPTQKATTEAKKAGFTPGMKPKTTGFKPSQKPVSKEKLEAKGKPAFKPTQKPKPKEE